MMTLHPFSRRRFDRAGSVQAGAVGVGFLLLASFGCGSSSNGPDAALGGSSPQNGGGSGTLGGAGSGGASASGGSAMPSGGTPGSGGSASGGLASGGAPNGGASGASGGGAGATTAGSGGAGKACMTPPPPSELIGWATEGNGTTGGGDAPPVVVTTAMEFSSNISGTAARVIHVAGNLTGSFDVGSNKTIVGVCGAQIQGDLGFNASSNVIVRNLKIVGNNCTDSPADCSGGTDAVGIIGGSHHLWFDHLDVSDGSDGNLDITQGSDFVTVSWTKFSYSSRRTDPLAGASGHRFSNLIGASDTDVRDPGHLNVTFHHCWWADNIDQRMPRTRRGQIHVLNNLYTSTGNSYCTNAGVEAQLLVENNVYIGVNRPLDVSSGNMRAVGNVFQNTTGSATASGTGFTPVYAYQADPTAGLEAAIRSGAGPQ